MLQAGATASIYSPQSPVCTKLASVLTYVPVEDGHQHVESPVQPHEPQADEHNKLQSWASPGPQVTAQQAELPAQVTPGGWTCPVCGGSLEWGNIWRLRDTGIRQRGPSRTPS